MINQKRLQANHYNLILLCVITCLGGGLRFFRLYKWSFSIDEIFTLGNAHQFYKTPISYHMLVEHPITSFLVYLTTQIASNNEWSARLPSAIIGVATIPILFFILNRLLGNHVALISTFILAISPWHLFWAQNARFYVLLSLLYMLALFSFYWGVEKNRPLFIYLSLFLLALAISERLLALFFIPVVITYLFLIIILQFERPPGLKWKNFYIITISSFFLGVVFAGEFIRNPTLWQQIYMTPGGREPVQVIVEFIKGIDISIAVLSFLGAVLGIYNRNRLVLLLTINIAVPLILLMAASTFQFTHNRYMFTSSISSFVLAAWMVKQWVMSIKHGVRRWLIIGVTVILLLLPINDLIPYYTYLHGWRLDWKSAFLFVEQNRLTPEDILMSNNIVVNQYYSDGEMYEMRSKSAALENIEYGNRQVWIVIGGTTRLDHNLHEWVQRHAVLVYSIEPKINIYLYDQIPAG